jgi:hypothetical protein
VEPYGRVAERAIVTGIIVIICCFRKEKKPSQLSIKCRVCKALTSQLSFSLAFEAPAFSCALAHSKLSKRALEAAS